MNENPSARRTRVGCRLPPAVIALLGLALVAAGCGGPAGSQTSSGSSNGTAVGEEPVFFEQGQVEHSAFLEPAIDPDQIPALDHDLPIQVATTVGQITDIVEFLGGERVSVEQVIPGADDPHLYVPSPGDVATLSQADVIFYNGLFLEGQLGETFERMRGQGIPTVAVSAGFDPEALLEREYAAGQYVTDPHIWFDPALWRAAAGTVATALSALDPAGAAQVEQRLELYQARLEQLEAWGAGRMATIPESQRILVTSHDAFQYFGRAFGVDVRGLQGLSTEVEAGTRDVVELADFITEHRIPAVFVEASVSPEALRAVVSAVRAEGGDVGVGGELFSDTPGRRGTVEGTYPGMVMWNVTTVVQALGGDPGEGPPEPFANESEWDYGGLFRRAIAEAGGEA